jgi:UPF0755 protein
VRARLKKALLALVLAAALAAPGLWAARLALLDHRAAPAGPERLVSIPRGAGLEGIAAILAREGVVDHPALFALAARLLGKAGSLQAGEYALSPAMSYRSLVQTLHQGRVVLHAVLIPEGFTQEQIIQRLARAGLLKAENARALASDPEFVQRLGLSGDSLEGYLFPDTYSFARGLGARAVLSRLVRRFQEAWKPLAPRAEARGMSRLETVTLASIIEAEAMLDQERPLISAVYHNRLAKGMPLQADPTVIYGLDDFDGNLRRSDLREDSPYNTYTRPGLPPGPICSPGAASLAAAVAPAQVDYLYFVAKGGGAHHFSSNYRQHVNAVNRYQRR